MDYYETDYLNPDEEFELRYADDMEALHEMEQDGLFFSHLKVISTSLIHSDD